jgi:hypothetical protein
MFKIESVIDYITIIPLSYYTIMSTSQEQQSEKVELYSVFTPNDSSDEEWEEWRRKAKPIDTNPVSTWNREKPVKPVKPVDMCTDIEHSNTEQGNTNPPSPHTLRNLELADRRAIVNTEGPWVRPQLSRGRGLPTRVPGVRRARVISADQPGNDLPVVQPYTACHKDPESQRKRSEWLQAWKDLPVLTEQQLTTPEDEQQSFVQRLTVNIRNIIGCAHELDKGFQELFDTLREPDYKVEEMPEDLRYYVAALLVMYGKYSEFLGICNLNDESLKEAGRKAAEIRAQQQQAEQMSVEPNQSNTNSNTN